MTLFPLTPLLILEVKLKFYTVNVITNKNERMNLINMQTRTNQLVYQH